MGMNSKDTDLGTAVCGPGTETWGAVGPGWCGVWDPCPGPPLTQLN